MDFKFLKLDNIFIDKNNFIRYKNAEEKIKKIEIVTPILYLPFGLDKDKNDNIQLNLQLRRTNCMKHNKELKLFLEFFQSLEKIICDKYKLLIKSNIKISDKYDPILQTKIVQSKNGVLTEVFKDKENFTIYKVKKGDRMKCIIFLDKIWIFNETLFYKIKLKKIFVKAFNTL